MRSILCLIICILITSLQIFKYEPGILVTTKNNIVPQEGKAQTKIKRCNARISYYPNSCKTFQLILSGDVELNPGPQMRSGHSTLNNKKQKSITAAPKCSLCIKGVGSNRKRLYCDICKGFTHANCANISTNFQIKITAKSAVDWTCNNCTLSQMPFSKICDLNSSSATIASTNQSVIIDQHKEQLEVNKHLLKIFHLNTQSLLSTFAEFEAMAYEYKFDILTLSETWFTDNQHLIDHVQIPGYNLYYRNRNNNKRGGGVAAYIRDNIKCKVRNDIFSLDSSIEHLWLEIQGKNRNSHFLLGVFYQPNFDTQLKQEWLKKFDFLIHNVSASWKDLLIITGDFNIDLFKHNCDITIQYKDILESHHLTQVVKKATRHGSTLIDHFTSNIPSKIKLCDVLPCCEISDHDGPYIALNARIERYQPRYKYIRDNNKFILNDYEVDFRTLPFTAVYALEDPEDKLDILNNLILSCLERHAPLKRTKFTRPPAPWLKCLDIQSLKIDRDKKRFTAHSTHSEHDWQKYRDVRNQLKSKIKSTKSTFIKSALSSNRPKEVWRFVHRILKPKMEVLDVNVDDLNNHFITTADRLLNSKHDSTTDLLHLLSSLPNNNINDQFVINHISYEDVQNELKNLRSDCSAGFDNISVQYMKPVYDCLASPLTHVINASITANLFPAQWKVNKISPIPKTNDPRCLDDFRPVSVLPLFSKVFERLIAKQICSYIELKYLLKDTISGFRKSHSTCTLMLKLRDDILKSMSKGELTLSIFNDYSKAFDTVQYSTIIRKLHNLGFSHASLEWFISYLSDRLQFVQVNDNKSLINRCNFGVPQGSVLGPILFNLYVSDLQDIDEGNVCQYADDTTQYEHCKISNLAASVEKAEERLNILNNWSVNNNLLFNPSKTKSILFSSGKMSKLHNLQDYNYSIKIKDVPVEKVNCWKVLGVIFQENLCWKKHIDQVVSSCYKKLFVLKKLKRFTPQRTRKYLAEMLILSKIDYGNVVYANAINSDLNRIQKLLKMTCCFVTGRYSNTLDMINLGWLPITQRINYSIIKLAHRAIYVDTFPAYLKLTFKTATRNLRSNSDTHVLNHFGNTKTFRGKSSSLFNELPLTIRSNEKYNSFSKALKSYLLDQAQALYLQRH